MCAAIGLLARAVLVTTSIMQRHQRTPQTRASTSRRLALTATAILLASVGSWACEREGNGIKEVPYTVRDVTPTEALDGDDQQGEGAVEPQTGEPGATGEAVDPVDADNSGFGFPGQVEQARAACPMLVDGVEVKYVESPGVATLEFRIANGDVEDLQRRVEHMARMYEMHDSGRGSTLWQHRRHMRGAMPHHGQGRAVGAIPPSTAKVDNFGDGARLTLRPTEPDDLEALRARVRSHHERMSAGECWMGAGGAQ